eukprot:TRINITY_DN78563_c0_g1_i1.p1 TRINITY_DN78563_c0_g1~~TRINITY_DN78563_c0_g1_i1.p1  ORF type:complete len:388 (-),score=58.83 TRINITY_DN78563_c0_g1_i1:154-1290(-)
MGSRDKLVHAKKGLQDGEIKRLNLGQGQQPWVEIDFSENDFTADGLQDIILVCLNSPDLEVLKLHKNRIDDNGAELLAQFVEAHPKITQLHLSHNRITERGATRLVQAADVQRKNLNLPPIWLRLERNEICHTDQVASVLKKRLSVCFKDNANCTAQTCANGCKVHLPFFQFQLGQSRATSSGRSRRPHSDEWKGADGWSHKGQQWAGWDDSSENSWSDHSYRSGWHKRKWEDGCQETGFKDSWHEESWQDSRNGKNTGYWAQSDSWDRSHSHNGVDGNGRRSDSKSWHDRDAGRSFWQSSSSRRSDSRRTRTPSSSPYGRAHETERSPTRERVALKPQTSLPRRHCRSESRDPIKRRRRVRQAALPAPHVIKVEDSD